MDVKIYTDGGCSGNPGPGAWAYLMMPQAKSKLANVVEKSGVDLFTTNNRMELSAVIFAIEALASFNSKIGRVTICTDSQYVQLGMTSWIRKWKLNKWKNSAGDVVKNAELWYKLDTIAAKYDITWQWVRGHDGDEFNERCDAIVKQRIKTLKQQAEKNSAKAAPKKPPAAKKKAAASEK